MDEDVRLRELERWAAETRTHLAVRAERDKHIDDRFDRLEATVSTHNAEQKKATNDINSKIGRVVWLVLAAILSAILNFLIKGGFGV